jgi:hypothetical protein
MNLSFIILYFSIIGYRKQFKNIKINIINPIKYKGINIINSLDDIE